MAQSRAIDAASARLGVSIRALMENAGVAVAQAAMSGRWGRRFDVLCGPGDNGGDGYVAARHLRDAGCDVRLLALGAPTKAAAVDAREGWGGEINAATVDNLRNDAVVIDALFGAGLSRPLDGQAAALALACAPRAVISVDAPSGLPGDGAAPVGPCFRADLTVTFALKKPAHVLLPGRDLCGEVLVADIGAPPEAVRDLPVYAQENAPSLWRLPQPDAATHKHARGRVLVRADAPSVSAAYGAQRLTAATAQRVGAGWVCVGLADMAAAVFFTTPMALLVQPIDSVEAARFDAVAIGPGAAPGPVVRAQLEESAGLGHPLVIDGGGLGVLGMGSLSLPPESVLTPHAGEFARLAPDLAEGTKIDRALAAAKRFGAVMVFKGADTVVAAPDGQVRVNTHAPPTLATAGAGDVLTGLITGLIAQGMAAFDAASAAVWLHGESAWRCGAGMIADDLVDVLPAVLREYGSP